MNLDHFDFRSRKSLVLVTTILLLLIFLFVVGVLRAFHPEAEGFERKGPTLIIYQLCRLDMILFICIFSYGAGYRVFEIFGISPVQIFGCLRKTFILCAFFGASLYGTVFTVLGLAGQINLVSALVCTIPMLILSVRPAIELLAGLKNFLRTDITDAHAGPITVRISAICAIVAVLLFLMSNVLFIPIYDPNIWEHYLHYYREVLSSGSTQPNEVWHHFYASKAAGLIILADVLSDFFGVQIASAFFVIMGGVIILDVLLEYCKSVVWAMFGATLFFLFLYGGFAPGAAFKHHFAMLGYAAFAFWVALRIQDVARMETKPLLIGSVVAFAYLGFYLPVAGVIIPAELFLVGLANLVLRFRPTFYALLTVAIAVLGGAILVFFVNWFLTGLLEVTPMRLTWLIADQAKVERTFGLGGIEYFLRINNDVSPEYDWSVWHAFWILRYPLSNFTMMLTVFGGLVVLYNDFTHRYAQPSVKVLAYLLAFILPLNLFAEVIQSDAVVERMALFSIVFTTIATIIIWKRLIEIFISRSFYHLVVQEVLVDAQARIKLVRSFLPPFSAVRRIASVLIIIWGMIFAYHQAGLKMGAPQRSIVRRFAIGQRTLKEAFRAMEELNSPRTGIGIDDMSDYRQTIGANDRFLRMTYDSGYSLSLPGRGIVSEPTYSVVDDPTMLLSAAPQEVASYLRRRNLSHFIFDERSRLFTTVAFTSLFDPHEMPKFLKVSYENNKLFIFTWKDENEISNIPDNVLSVIDFKRSGILNFPFTKHFYSQVVVGNRHVDDLDLYRDVKQTFLTDVATEFSEVLPTLSLASSQEKIRHIWNIARFRVENSGVDEVLHTLADAQGHLMLAKPVEEVELRRRFMAIFISEVRREYIEAFGLALANLSFDCDERVTFGIRYPSWAVCR